jgi:hypothetical protein
MIPMSSPFGGPPSAMGGNLMSGLSWGDQPLDMPMPDPGGFSPAARQPHGAAASRRRDANGKSKPCRKSVGDHYNSRASHFANLTPWNKIEMLNEICPDNFGMIYMADASLDELDAAIMMATGMTPYDRVLFKDKATQFKVTPPCCHE